MALGTKAKSSRILEHRLKNYDEWHLNEPRSKTTPKKVLRVRKEKEVSSFAVSEAFVLEVEVYDPLSGAKYFSSDFSDVGECAWGYRNVMEAPDEGLCGPVINIGGVKFRGRCDCEYESDYVAFYDELCSVEGVEGRYELVREMVLKDLWFLCYFVMRNPLLNHPFAVEACHQVQIEDRDMLEVWARDHLKAVDLNEDVITPNGWKKHGELCIGDLVYGPDGEEARVIGVSEVFETGDCYRVSFTDGNSLVVNGDHLWRVERKSRKRIKGTKNQRVTREEIILSTRALANYNHEADSRFAISVAKPLKGTFLALPFSPYVLGVWLGDGASANGTVTCADNEIWQEVQKEGFRISAGRPNYKITRTIYDLQKKLRPLGLLNNKHIPEVYLRAEVRDRLALLQGLMDTDGTCNDRHTASFANKNKRLAEEVYELCNTLGLNPKFYSVHCDHGEVYFINFQAYKDFPVFRLSRKLKYCALGARKNNRKFILAVERVLTIATSCIKVDREDGMYLVGRAMVPTHNTTIISTGRTVQRLMRDPERRFGIFSATKSLAVRIYNMVKRILETEVLTKAFPDILYDKTRRQKFSGIVWKEHDGLVLKRKGIYKEMSLSPWGLVEGLPTGDHYTDLVFDDIVTPDTLSPEVMRRVIEQFDMAENLATRARQMTVVGTFYRHDDPLTYIAGKKFSGSEEPMFSMRKKPATIDGTFGGKSVFLPEAALDRKRAGVKYIFYCQQLLNPTPMEHERLNPLQLIKIVRKDLPMNLYKFMSIDGAGDRGERQRRFKNGGNPDAWAIGVIGVEPYRDDIGASRIYILDLVIEEMDLETAQRVIVDMYCRNGRIKKVGVEKVGMSTLEIHICNALRAKKRYVSKELGNLELLNPRGRSKEYRIESSLTWPLKNGKVHYLDTIREDTIKRLCQEMEKFPMWKDDGIDMLSYVFDMIKSYRFGEYVEERDEEEEEDITAKPDKWDLKFRKGKGLGWQYV